MTGQDRLLGALGAAVDRAREDRRRRLVLTEQESRDLIRLGDLAAGHNLSLHGQTALARLADRIKTRNQLDTVLCDECGTHTTDPETCPHGREHCPECRENGYACNTCRGEHDPRWNR